MPNLNDARRAVDLEAQARRKRSREGGRPPPDMPADRLELAALILVELWAVADRFKLGDVHYGRTLHMVKCALDVALAPKDEEARQAKRAALNARARHNRRTWRSGRRWQAALGQRAPGVEQVSAPTGPVARWRLRDRSAGMVQTAPGGRRPHQEPQTRKKTRRELRAERSAAWRQNPANANYRPPAE